MPSSSNRYCVRHIYANFRCKFPGALLKNHLWAAARSSNLQEFKEHMDAIKEVDVAAHEWLSKIPSSSWSVHAFDPKIKTLHVTNNLTESFNGSLGASRSKPVLCLLEDIRRKWMGKIRKRYEASLSWTCITTPNVKKKLDDAQKIARKCSLIYAGEDEFEVDFHGTKYVVNLRRLSCSCGSWQISGLPCFHAIACILYSRKNPEEYCHQYYKIDAYKRTYQNIIHPIPDQKSWLPPEHEDIMPPPLKRHPGRPKKARKRDQFEPPAPGNQIKRSCSLRCCICKQFGHNKRTCQRAPTRSSGTGNTVDGSDSMSIGRGRGRGRGRGTDINRSVSERGSVTGRGIA